MIAARGRCTYTAKVRNAQHASAGALLIVNNEEGLLHPPGPDGKDLGEGPEAPFRGFRVRYIFVLMTILAPEVENDRP